MLIRPKIFGGEVERDATRHSIMVSDGLVSDAREDAKKGGFDFFRMDTDGTVLGGIEPITAGLYLGYPSISTFNSAANKDLNRFLKQFGFDTNYNYFTSGHSYSSPAADSLFGVRYVLTDRKNFGGYSFVEKGTDEAIALYENNTALPIMYAVKADAGDFDFYRQETETRNKDPFLFQNDLFQSLFGRDAFAEPVYYPEQTPEPEVYNAILKDTMTKVMKETENESTSEIRDTDLLGNEPYDKLSEYGTTYMRINDGADIVLSYTLSVTDSDPLFLSIPAVNRNSEAFIYLNDEYYDYLSPSSFSRIISLGAYKEGEKVTVEIRADSDTYSMLPVLFYYLDTELFERQMAAATDLGQVTISEISDGYAEADVQVKEDSLILTTIPYEDGWTLLVDGQKTAITPYQNALISVPVTAGRHTVKLTFQAPGLAAGAAVSAGSALVFAAAWIADSLRKRKKE